MTTIAYAKGILAADGRQTIGDTIWDEKTKKIHRIRGHVIAICGDEDCEDAFLRWYREGCPDKKPKLDGDFQALIFAPGRKIFSCENNCVLHDISHKRIVAIGCGKDLALGAMESGASARKAVKVAMKYNTATGGRLQYCRVWGRK